MNIELMDLPYAYDALEPVMSRETLTFHHDKHHRGYVDKLNKLLAESKTSAPDLETLVRESQDEIFNNAAQVWNHNFFWKCLRPPGRAAPPAQLLDALTEQWDTLDEFQQEFGAKAMAQFGSGWAWLVLDRRGEFDLKTTDNADTPLRQGIIPLLTCDVWEHAYYIDYRNQRDKYLEALWKVVNWNFVEAQRQAALQSYQLRDAPRSEGVSAR